jgi:hypothetical protein
MPLPRNVLEDVAKDLGDAESMLVDLKDVISDMRYAGMDVAEQEREARALEDDIRKLRIFYERQKAKVS